MRLNSRYRNALVISLRAWAILLILTCLGPFSGFAGTQEKKFKVFDRDNFSNSTQIDNKWLPLKPGTRYVYEGTTIEDGGTAGVHRVVINVTDITKVIGGVPGVVTWDLDCSADELVEIVQLGAEALMEVRAKALALEKRAYEVSKNVYAHTVRLEHASGIALKTDKPMVLAQHTAAGRDKASKITEDQAVKIALQTVPGVVTAVAIEKKLGANRYVVEILAEADGVETDVIIDMMTGEVLGTEK